jgi:hypothetical protein
MRTTGINATVILIQVIADFSVSDIHISIVEQPLEFEKKDRVI